MKLSFILILVGSLQLSASVLLGQQVSLQATSSLVDVLEDLNNQTGIYFMYNVHEIDDEIEVQLDMEDASLEEVLNEICKQAPIEYEIVEDFVIITKKDPVPVVEEVQEKKELKGKVTDKDGIPLPGVSVVIKGTNIGVATNVDGEYTLELKEGKHVLIFSFVGMITQEINIKGKTIQNVILLSDSEQMEEVVVTGYQTIKKVNATGSFATIKPDDIELKRSSGLDGLLEGTVPGLTSYKGDYQIRGISSLSAETNPLFVVDGFEVDEVPKNLNDIEKVTVLKDAAATAIWGSRAANGIVLITTKKGQKGKARITYTNNFRFSEMVDLSALRKANSADMIDFEKELNSKDYTIFNLFPGAKSGYSAATDLMMQNLLGQITNEELDVELDKLAKLDNSKQIKEYLLRNKFQQNHYLSLSGGNEQLTYFLSGSFSKEKSGYVGSNSRSVNINSRNSYKLTPFLKVSADISANFGSRNNGYVPDVSFDKGGYNFSPSIAGIRPYQMLVDNKGDYIYDYSSFSKFRNDQLTARGYLDNSFNYLEEVRLADNKTTDKNYRIKTGIELKLIDGLDLLSEYYYEDNFYENNNRRDAKSYEAKSWVNQFSTEQGGQLIQNIPEGDMLDTRTGNTKQYALKSQLNYKHLFNDEKHNVNATAGFEIRKRKSSRSIYRKFGYDDQLLSWIPYNAKTLSAVGIRWWDGNRYYYNEGAHNDLSYVENREVSYYASAIYTYNRKYTLSGSFRIDESNLFGADKKYRKNPLWSFGGSWNLKEENFFNSNVITALKLRASYGITGNFDRNNSTTPLLVSHRSYNNKIGDYTARIFSPPNPKLRWEKTSVSNIAVDLAVRNRLFVSLEYYQRIGTDLLGTTLLDPTLGFTSVKINASKMNNKGLEGIIEADVIRSGKFLWKSNFNMAYNENKVIDNKAITRPVNRPRGQSVRVEGYSAEGIWSYKWAGLDELGNPQTYDGNGKKTTTLTDESIEFSGTTRPKLSCGFTNTFRYGNLKLQFSFVGNFGHVMRMKYPGMNYFFSANDNELIAQRWKEPGDETKTDIPSLLPLFDSFSNPNRHVLAELSSNSIRDADYIRLREVILEYQLPAKWLKVTPVKRASLTFQANSVYLWTKNKEGIDPEFVNPYNGYTFLPTPRSYVAGLRIEF